MSLLEILAIVGFIISFITFLFGNAVSQFILAWFMRKTYASNLSSKAKSSILETVRNDLSEQQTKLEERIRKTELKTPELFQLVRLRLFNIFLTLNDKKSEKLKSLSTRRQEWKLARKEHSKKIHLTESIDKNPNLAIIALIHRNLWTERIGSDNG